MNLRSALAIILMTVALVGAAVAQVGTVEGDPFARLDAQLDAAVSRTLDRAVQPHPNAAATRALATQDEALKPMPAANIQSTLQRVERLRPVLEPILREVGVPAELAAVVLVESGGQPTALSPKGARGLWQLMPDTARRYGLVVNGERDERLDVLRSTRAAAEYLRDLYAQFQDWRLVLAAYNAGAQAVQRAVLRTGTPAFSIARLALPLETQNYVPAVLNALGRFGRPAPPQFTSRIRLQHVVYAASGQ